MTGIAGWTRRVVLVCAVLIPGGSMASSAHASEQQEHPNIVLILLDNVGQEWFGCYGSEEHCTPNIDELARTGVRVENCYTPPVCGPSRTVLLTGQYPHTTGFRLHHDAALYSGGGLNPEREILFPRLLRDAGYATCMTGKWQVNNLYDEPDVLTRHGFQEQLVWPGSINRSRISDAEWQRFQDIVRRQAYAEAVAFNTHIESRYWNPVFFRNGVREEKELAGTFGPDQSHAFAVDFMRRHREQPFFLYLPMVLTHGQSFTENVVPTPLNGDASRPHHEMFADMLRYADQLIGEVVTELENLGLRDNTFVIVASDNGTESRMSARRNGRIVQGDLYSLTEAGGNVVLLANCPARIPGGRTLPLADFTDIYPTVCDLAGVLLSEDHRPDGVSFASFLRGEQTIQPARTWILNEYHKTRVVRDEQYKLYSDGRLYDANADPAEQHDLAAAADPEVSEARARLRAVLDALPPDSPPPFPLRSLSAFRIYETEIAPSSPPKFRVHQIAQPGGDKYGQTSAVDVDRDGDPDFVSGRQYGTVFWFENRGGEQWLQHRIGDNAQTDVGGTAFDVDGDGWVDQVSGGTWFRNPGDPQTGDGWQRFENGATPTHDNVAADIDGDGRLDLVSLLDKAGVFWYRIPDDATQPWKEHRVIGVTQPQCHGGLAIGDIDGDGDADITRVDRWFENDDGRGETWKEHLSFDFGMEGPWGLQTRAQLVDVDRDGDLDLIQAEGDVFDGRVAWFENVSGNGREWARHMIRESGHRQDFHSLCAADFDNDGDVDVFTGAGPLTQGEHLWFLWINADGRGGQWQEHVIQKGLRTHESVCADVDGDGDIDILTKPWRGDLHLFVENLTVNEP